MKAILQPQRLAGLALAAGLALPLVGQAQLCTPGNYQASVESGNIKTTLLNGGDMFWNLSDARFEVPKGSGKHSIYGGAFWFGGLDQTTNQLNISTQTFRQGSPAQTGFWPGPLDANGATDATVCSGFNFIAKAHKAVIDDFKTLPTPVDQANIPHEILMWPAKGNPFSSAVSNYTGGGQLAPFMDVNGDGIYDPREGDYPVIPGDQALFTIMNDMGGVKQPFSPGMGLEVQVMMYGFDAPNNPAVANTIFAQYVFINRGSKTLTDTYFGQWADFDLGYYMDDFIASDSTRNMFYAYNGDNDDEGVSGYGTNPPSQGVIFLNVPMTSFITYNNNASAVNGNPFEDTDYYNYMRSRWGNGNQITYGGNGVGGTTPGNYMYSGNPVTGTGWTEATSGNTPEDRRGVGAHGPFTFAPGNIKVFEVAFPFAQGSSNIGSVAELQQAASEVQNFYSVVMGNEAPVAEQTLALQLYPNPTKANVTVQCTGTAAEATFTLRDLTGRTVLQTAAQLPTGVAQHQLNLERVPQGMYLLQVQRGEISQTVRVVKQ